MSLPYLSYSCSHCDFTASNPFFGSCFSYDGPSGLLPLSYDLGWCNECMDLAAIEDLPSPYKIDELIADINKQKELIAELNDRLMKSRPWFKQLFNISVAPTSKIRSLGWQCEIMENKMRRNQRLLSLLTVRKSKPRCLKCGSTDNFIMPNLISPLKIDYPFNSSEELPIRVKIGYQHPSCGGDFLIEYSGVWLEVAQKHRVYDIEGRFIRS